MNGFRLLTADEIECRISQISDKGLALLLYKTARTDANLLDERYGPFAWQNDFKIVDNVLYGGIGLREVDGEWVWKWDAGTESNTEAEKGRASDAFKRAGFKWGIGRELYTAPRIWISADKCNIRDRKCYDNFEVGPRSAPARPCHWCGPPGLGTEVGCTRSTPRAAKEARCARSTWVTGVVLPGPIPTHLPPQATAGTTSHLLPNRG